MDKIISIIVPTYNMESLLPRCLDSLTKECVPSSVEVIVVNDGSKDGSLCVANEYKKLRPDIITIIDKDNGNYGSCINVALKQVRGKYVKVLDADDWFSTNDFVSLIERLYQTDVDVIITPFQKVYEKVKKSESRDLPLKFQSGKFSTDEIFKGSDFLFLPMHMLAYKTVLLRDIRYIQTEGVSYTDSEWVFKPIFHAKTVEFVNSNVYRYLLGRDGQTMDPKVVLKSLSQELIVLRSQVKYRKLHKEEVDSENVIKYIDFTICRKCILIYTQLLLKAKSKDFNEKIIDEMESILSHDAMDLYKRMLNFDIRCFVVRYWRRKRRRLPKIVRIIFCLGLYIVKLVKSA